MKIPYTNDLSYKQMTNWLLKRHFLRFGIKQILKQLVKLQHALIMKIHAPPRSEDERQRGSQIDLFFCSSFDLFIHLLHLAIERMMITKWQDFTFQACSSNRRYLRKWRGEGAGSQLLSTSASLLLLFFTCCALLATNNDKIKRYW